MSIILTFLKKILGIEQPEREREPEFTGSGLIMRHPVNVNVLVNGSVEIIFKGKKYVFEKQFHEEHPENTFQLFIVENIIMLVSELMFASFVFENDCISKINYKDYQEWKNKWFSEKNIIVFSFGRMILAFTQEENKMFSMRHYPIRDGIDGGILTFVEGTPYFVCCIHPLNSSLIVVSINLITGQQNTVLTLTLTETDKFGSFETRDCSLFIKIFDKFLVSSTQTLVDPLKIHEPRESFLPSNFVSNKPLDISCGSKMVALIISGHPVEVLIKPNYYDVHIFFKGTKYTFKRPFGDDHSTQKLQLFSYDNMIVLLSESGCSGRKLALFMYEGDVFTKIEFCNKKGSAFRCFVKRDLIVLCARDKALSFIQEFGNFTMRDYSILHRIDGGILTVVEEIPSLVVCVDPVDSETKLKVVCVNPVNPKTKLKVVSINLFTKEQKKVLEMNPDDYYMAFAQLDGHLYLDTTSIAFVFRSLNPCRKLVDPSKNVREEPEGIFSYC